MSTTPPAEPSFLERSGITLARLPGPGAWKIGDQVSLVTGPDCGVLSGLNVVGLASEVDSGGLLMAYFPAPFDQASHLRLKILPEGFGLDVCPGPWSILASASVYVEVSLAGKRYAKRLLLDELMDRRSATEFSMEKAGREVLLAMEQAAAFGCTSNPAPERQVIPRVRRLGIGGWPFGDPG